MTPILTHTTLLAVLAILTRGVGVTLRLADVSGLRLAGWLICATATWAAAGAAGAFSPIWPVLAIGLLGGLLEWSERSGWFFAAGDVAVVVVVLVTSTPRLAWQVTAVFVLALAMLWGMIEAVVRASGPRLRLAGGSAGAAVAVLLLLAAGVSGPGLRLLPLPSMLPHLAVSSQCDGERIVLQSGAVGWLDAPAAWRGGTAALHLHGNDGRGSRQPAACALRRALVHASFLTLAVDHPGYGQSPHPPIDAPVEAWDFTPAHEEAYEWLAARPGVERVIVVGHSMGVQNAIRLARARPDIPLLFLFSGSLGEPGDRADYWYMRFHRERGLRDSIPRRKWAAIEETYYRGETAVRALPAEHGLMVFATAGHEWDDVTVAREPLYELLPGAKERWHLHHASHYFNAFQTAGVTFGDARVARRVAAGIRSRAAEALDSRE